ncbi:MAG TPA: hypothetical protein PKE12_03470 [Kiritimatiellia bacterium]|nr:hypothetical protein [Kiritimatiellia bacterium]
MACALAFVLFAVLWPFPAECHHEDAHHGAQHESCAVIHNCGSAHASALAPVAVTALQRPALVAYVVAREPVCTGTLVLSPPFEPPRA